MISNRQAACRDFCSEWRLHHATDIRLTSLVVEYVCVCVCGGGGGGGGVVDL